MDIAIGLLVVAGTVLAGAWLADRIRVPAPLVLMLLGIIGSYLPFVPEVSVSPELILLGFLPPLLYAAAIQTSLIDFRANRISIVSLSVGLVLFTALGVGLFLWWILPIPFAVAFALGAVVGPPDAVAATSIGRQIGLPRRIVSILEGESLVNDATALVSLRTALAAAGLASSLGGNLGDVNAGSILLDFAWASAGGVAIGLAVAAVIEVVRRKLSRDATFDTILSIMAPFLAYVPAEELHASGVISVVACGLILGHRSPRTQPGASRLSERINWSSIQFLLENTVFLLIGLRVFYVIDSVRSSDLPLGQIIAAAGGTFVLVLLLRPAWVFPYSLLSTRILRAEPKAPWSYAAIVSWAGMRGVVTLAAALLLPEDTPQRDVLVLIAVVVTIGSLLLQGTTLPALARLLGVQGPDPREDVLQAASALQASAAKGLEVLEHEPDVGDSTRELLTSRSRDRVNAMWERLGRRDEDADETPSEQYRRVRSKMIAAERDEVLRMRDAGQADFEVLRDLLGALDLEETVLERIDEADERREGELRLPPQGSDAGCEHLAAASLHVSPRTPQGCEECLRDGTSWVHLRMCLECGHVGCCDSSEGKHADRHFEETQHPVMRSIEPGEAWRWCYVDELLG
ncbi:MAG: Na+/H+ antiporter [Terracoccus sp.]